MEKNKSSKARERRLRAKYRKNLQIAIIACLLIGLAIGFALGRMTVPVPKHVPVSQSSDAANAPGGDVQATPHTLTLATPAPTPTPQPKEFIVPFNSTQPFSVQVHNDGSIRREDDALSYETLNFSIRVDRYLSTDYYMDKYGDQFQMDGTQTGIEFTLILNDYMGSLPLDPQAYLDIHVENASGQTDAGFKLIDAEFKAQESSRDIRLTTNVPMTLYKRFQYTPSVGEMKYMVVTAYVDGVPYVYKFELGTPVRPTVEPAATYNTLNASTPQGEEVKKLQRRLIELGFMPAGSDDGFYGANTETGVKNAQTSFGMEVNGIADNAFQQRLYAENP